MANLNILTISGCHSTQETALRQFSSCKESVVISFLARKSIIETIPESDAAEIICGTFGFQLISDTLPNLDDFSMLIMDAFPKLSKSHKAI